MCGLAGFVSKIDNKNEIIKKMTDRIAHRGPDGEGFYIDENIALGHRRLSIIDLSNTGNQPMYNEDKTLVIVFNGEIYNYQDLRSELLSRGHSFSSSSDTEVLLHGYEEWGTELPNHLRGMFAFVIYDIKQKILFGARDHFGIKPLYYATFNNTFMFASEIKSFLDHPEFKKELNEDVIAPYLTFNFSPGEDTFFKSVKKLNPGHSFLYKDNRLRIDRYFYLTFDEQNKDINEIVEEISLVINDSVEHHMLSDVEVGSFLSSGVDSSYLVALAKPDKTYTVGYDIEKYNEIGLAKDLADKLGINNTNKIISKDDYINIIPKIMYHLDEPLADPAAVALYFVSELASRDVKVVLSGEGADEFFGGYNYYFEEIKYQGYNKIPFFLRKLISKAFNLLPEFKGQNFFVRRGQRLEDYYVGVNWIFRESEVKRYLKKKPVIKLKDYTKDVFKEQQNQNNIIKMQAIDINFWLIKDILQKADRMTMANSIEGRVPFTDIKVFELARSLPFSAKVTKDNTKVAMREAAKKVLPNESYKKKKLGFPVPLREWMKEEDIYNKIKVAFDTDIAKKIFNQKEIYRLLDDHKNSKNDNYKKVWTIYCFIIWYQEFFTND